MLFTVQHSSTPTVENGYEGVTRRFQLGRVYSAPLWSQSPHQAHDARLLNQIRTSRSSQRRFVFRDIGSRQTLSFRSEMQSRKDRLLLPPVIVFLLFLRLDQLDKVDTKRNTFQVGHFMHYYCVPFTLRVDFSQTPPLSFGEIYPTRPFSEEN